MEKERLLNAKQVAEKLGISKQTLFRYEKKGILPKARRNLINHWRQYTEEDILKDKENKTPEDIKTPIGQPEEIAQEVLSPEEEDPSLRTNPFLAPEEEDFLKSQEGKLVINYLKLTAVFYSPPSSRAIIDGKIFKEGDIVDNKQIVKINPEEIILKDTKGEYIISMKNVLGRDS
jgi:DNA-binding transcriptional MerR regulator